MKHYLNWINGKARASSSGKYFKNISPCDVRNCLGFFPKSNKKDVHLAVTAANKAFQLWRKLPAPKRGEILFKIARRFELEKDSFSKVMSHEMGKTLDETLAEVQEVIDAAFYYAGEGRRLAGETLASELPNKHCMTLRLPLGVCGMITPWNFPAAVPAWKLFPAIISGNTMVWKPAEDSPQTAHEFVQICEQEGLPAGVLNVVHGSGEVAGDALVTHPSVRLISFTGSSKTGAVIAAKCAAQHKRHSLEMGGKNVQIVCEDANLDLAVEGALWGAFGTSGQRCTATSRVLLHQSIAKKFTARFLKEIPKLIIGEAMDARTEIGPLINAKQMRRVLRYIEIGKREGARIVLGGKTLMKKGLRRGFFFEPTVFVKVKPSMRIAREEIFGPVVTLLEFKTWNEAIAIANATDYGLSSSVYTKDMTKAFAAMRDLEAGITYINGPTIGAEVHLPFGGVKKTGSGHREAGKQALDIFTEWKTVYVDYSGKLQKAQVD